VEITLKNIATASIDYQIVGNGSNKSK